MSSGITGITVICEFQWGSVGTPVVSFTRNDNRDV